MTMTKAITKHIIVPTMNNQGNQTPQRGGSLRRSSRSTRTARPIDPPYWSSLGYDATTSMNMANFTHFVHSCQIGKQDIFSVPYIHDGERFVPFHEQLLPHWRVFMKTLHEEGGSTLSISHAQMPRQVTKMIIPAIISMPQLCRLEFERNNLDRDGFAAVAEILRHQSTLRILALPENEINSVESAQLLSTAITSHPNLERIRLSDCGIGKDVGVLEAILDGCKGIGLLDLRRNHIDSMGVDIVANFIAANHDKVDTLDLEGNSLVDDDVPRLVTAVKGNTNLRNFDVTENALSENGKVEMMKAVFDSSSLNNVVGSNHHCRLVLSSSGNNDHGHIFFFLAMNDSNVPFEEDMQTVNTMETSVKEKIQFKLIHALQDTSDHEVINLQLLNDAPVQCMPRVLQMVQTSVGIAEPIFGMGQSFFYHPSMRRTCDDLSYLFHVVKAMPLLFQYGPVKSSPKRRAKRLAKKPARKGRAKRKRSVLEG